MIEKPTSSDDEQLLLNSLITYGDACARPTLTPSCPYYRKDSAGVPYCNEECRTLLAKLGVRSRPVRQVQIGGLVMQGRELPRTAAVGVAGFDAQQLYLTDRQKPPASQSSSSLLMGLNAAMTEEPLEEYSALKGRAQEIWFELGRRGLPVEAIVRAGVLPSVTAAVSSFSLLPAMLDADLLRPAASNEYLERLRDLSDRTWGSLLAQALQSEESVETARSLANRTFRPDLFKRHLSQNSPPPFEFDPEESAAPQIAEVLQSDLRFTYAISGRFLNRVQDWLNRLLTEGDIAALSAWTAPPFSLFVALSDRATLPDTVGLWIWERYTVTNVEDWAESSLSLEWQVHNDIREPPLPLTVWAERRTDEGQVANLALLKSSRRHDRIPRPRNGLQADDFVSTAIRLLRFGEIQQAADIYFGLAELRPKDAQVLNNLGFCLIPLDLGLALKYLQRASIYLSDETETNAANRVLVLHLLERNMEATRLANVVLSSGPEDGNPAVLWEHVHGGGFRLLEMANAREYIERLREHMAKSVL